MRILSIGHSYALACNRAVMREVARDPEFRVTIAAPECHAGDLRPIHAEPEPPASKVELVTLPARWTRRVHVFHYDYGRLRRLIKNGNFDAVHAWEEPYIFAGYQVAKACERVATQFCFLTSQNLPKKYWPPFSHFERFALRRSQRWLGCGKTVLDNMIRRGYPADSGRVMTLAVDTESFVPQSEERRAVLRESLKLRPPVIGFMGRLVHAKGLRVLMEAIQGLDPATEWSLLLLGSGEMDREIRQWAAERGWTERVRIHLAKHDEVPKYLPAMDLLLAPSQTMANWKEQFGRMLVEAFASGVPVIASDSGEIPHVIGDAGSILPERDVARWTAEIDRYLKDPDLRRSKAAAGLRRVKQFSVKELARQHRQLFRELLNTAVVTRGYGSAINTGRGRVYGSN